jgi:SAM-dependent methyltransferase
MLSWMVRNASRHVPATPVVPMLIGPHRSALAKRLADERAAPLAYMTEGVLSRDAATVARFDDLVADALATLRADRPPGLARLLTEIDSAFQREGEELLDDPFFPEHERVRVLETLDRFNRDSEAYGRWMRLVEPLVERAQQSHGGPARVLELAAGHGSFALAVAEHFGDRVEVTASDIRDEYLELGRRRTRGRAQRVRFVLQDATDLRDVHDVDILLCTQSLHHFPPGMVARMVGEASRAARAGALFVDGERSIESLLLAVPVLFAYGRTWPVLHDSVVSVRRMLSAEEMRLVASLAPGVPDDVRVEVDRLAPGYVTVRMTAAKPRSS